MSDTTKSISTALGANINFRKWLIGRLGIMATDIIRFWPIPVVLSGIVMLAFYFSSYRNEIVAYHGILGMMCFIAGLACINDDRERGTLRLLRLLPVGATRLLIEKLFAALCLVATFMFISEMAWQTAQSFGSIRMGWLNATLGKYDRWSAWNFGASYSLSAAQMLCMVMIALGVGAVFKNFVYSAIAGLGIYVSWNAAWNYGFRFLEASNRTNAFHTVMASQQILLCLISAILFVRVVRGATFPAKISKTGTSEAEKQSSRKALRWRIPWEIEITPYGRRMFMTALCTGIMAAVAAGILNDYTRQKTDAHWILVLLPAAALGVSLFSKEELSSVAGLVYLQPVSRKKLLNERLRALALYTALATLPVLFVLTIFASPLLLLPVIALCMGTAMLAALGRLFYRNPIFPLILVGVITCEWALGYIVIFDHQSHLLHGDDQIWQAPVPMQYTAWYCAIVTLLPLLALKIAYQKSNLLALKESTRSFLGISVLYTVALLGGLLITALPGELLWLTLHAIFSPLGLNVGGAQ